MNLNNVLIISPNPNRKGGIASVVKIYKEQFNLKVFASTKFQSTAFSFLFLFERLISFLLFLLRDKSVKIVHIHSSSEGSFYRKYFFYKISKLFKKKVIFHIHSGRFHNFYNDSNKFIKSLIEEVIDNSDALIVLSKHWESYFKKTFKNKNVYIVHNIVEKPVTTKKTYMKAGEINILYLGKIFKEKGIYELLDCIVENYKLLSPKIRLVVAGKGDEEYTKKYRDIDTKKIISFPGWIGKEEKIKALKNTDILILPSYNEGLPVSILEAMSYKLPIIATPVGGIPEVLLNKVNGLIIQPKSVEAIKEAITYYIDNPEDIAKHGDASFNMIQGYFPSEVKKSLVSIYTSVLNHHA